MILEADPGHPAGAAPDGPARRRPLRDLDLNDLYRRVINRNNRLKRLLDLGAPEIIVNNEKRMLQEAVDALFDNGRRGRPVTGPGNRPLKSLSTCSRASRAGSARTCSASASTTRAARSSWPARRCAAPVRPAEADGARAVQAVHHGPARRAQVGPEHQGGQEDGRLDDPEVWDVLEEVIQEHPVLLNRAPTLHRPGPPGLRAGAGRGQGDPGHPLVCSAFNADFDGDQMAVHLPLSAEAQAEARC
jgi:DNA-directed RNA polymerase subunit beta'